MRLGGFALKEGSNVHEAFSEKVLTLAGGLIDAPDSIAPSIGFDESRGTGLDQLFFEDVALGEFGDEDGPHSFVSFVVLLSQRPRPFYNWVATFVLRMVR